MNFPLKQFFFKKSDGLFTTPSKLVKINHDVVFCINSVKDHVQSNERDVLIKSLSVARNELYYGFTNIHSIMYYLFIFRGQINHFVPILEVLT